MDRKIAKHLCFGNESTGKSNAKMRKGHENNNDTDRKTQGKNIMLQIRKYNKPVMQKCSGTMEP